MKDSSAPTFSNLINGQINLRDAIRRQIDFEVGGKKYKLTENPAVLIVRYVYFPNVLLILDHCWITAREGGTSTNLASQSTIPLYQARSLTLLCTFTTMHMSLSSVDPDRTSIFQKWNIISRPVSGMTFSYFLNLISACPTTQFVPLFLLKLFLLLSIWRRSFLN